MMTCVSVDPPDVTEADTCPGHDRAGAYVPSAASEDLLVARVGAEEAYLSGECRKPQRDEQLPPR